MHTNGYLSSTNLFIAVIGRGIMSKNVAWQLATRKAKFVSAGSGEAALSVSRTMKVLIVSLLTAVCVSGGSTRKGSSAINTVESGTLSQCSVHKACRQCNQNPWSRRDIVYDTCLWCHVNTSYGVCLSSVDVDKCPTAGTQRIVNTTQKCNADAQNPNSTIADAFCEIDAGTSLLRISARDVYGEQGDAMGNRLRMWFNPCSYVINQSVLHQCGQRGMIEIIGMQGSLVNCRTFGHSKSTTFVEHGTTHEVVVSLGKTSCSHAVVKVKIFRNCDETEPHFIEAPFNFSNWDNCSHDDELIFSVSMCYYFISNGIRTSLLDSWYIYAAVGGLFLMLLFVLLCAILHNRCGCSCEGCFQTPYELSFNEEPPTAPVDRRNGTETDPDHLTVRQSTTPRDEEPGVNAEINVATDESLNLGEDQDHLDVNESGSRNGDEYSTIATVDQETILETESRRSITATADVGQQKVDGPDSDSSESPTATYDSLSKAFRNGGDHSAQTTSEVENVLSSENDGPDRTRGVDVPKVKGQLQSSPPIYRDDRN